VVATVTVKTHSLAKPFARDAGDQPTCAFCTRQAMYWTQREQPLGGVVYHCQAHREDARRKAETLPRRVPGFIL
jgi:hypothetical protein